MSGSVTCWPTEASLLPTNPGMRAEHYSRFQRQRLVEFARKLNRSDIDAGITAYIQCTPQRCAEMAARYGTASRMEESDAFRHAYHIFVDGNGAVERLARYMCSGSLALLGTVMQEWYFRRVHLCALAGWRRI